MKLQEILIQMFYSIECNDLEAYVKLRKIALEIIRKETHKLASSEGVTYH
jgi:hypothetical protein